MMKDNNGFTTIELMVTIVIAGLITGAVGAFLNFSIRSYNVTEDIIDVQYEAQMAINQLSDIAREAKGINSFLADLPSSTGTSDVYTSLGLWSVHSFVIEVEVKNGDDIDYLITYDDGEDGDITNDNKIMISINGKTPYVMVEKIESFAVAPMKDQTFQTTNGIAVYLVVKDKEATYPIETQIKFRNKE